MASFVNLMGNDVWSETDIVNRTEAILRSEISRDAEMILSRKATGALLGQYMLTDDEQAELDRFAQLSAAARQAGIEARADMALLQAALDYEAAQRRLVLPPYEGQAMLDDGAPNPHAVADAQERAAAQAKIDTVAPETVALVAVRAAAAGEAA